MNNQQIRTVSYNNCDITFILIRKSVKNINLRVKSNGEICVSANKKVPLRYIDDFILSKADFIIKHLNNIKIPTINQFADGENFYFLGNCFTISLIKNQMEFAEIHTNFLYINAKDTENFELKQKIIQNFYDSACNRHFFQIIDEFYPIFQKMNIPYPNFQLKTLKSKWGSCNPRRNLIILNKNLIKFPISCIEYVIVHEFCHFIHQNHSKDFYNLVASIMPDWKERNNLLKNFKFN